MKRKNRYKIERNGEVHYGTADELAKIIGTTKATIIGYGIYGKTIGGWKITKQHWFLKLYEYKKTYDTFEEIACDLGMRKESLYSSCRELRETDNGYLIVEVEDNAIV